jgi:WD40 repeat protein
MRLSVWPIARYKLFEGSLTCISRASDWEAKGSPHLVAVGSFFDPRIFVLSLDEKDGFDIAMTLTSELGPVNPTSLIWTDRSLHVIMMQGHIASYSSKAILAHAIESTHSVGSVFPESLYSAPDALLPSSPVPTRNEATPGFGTGTAATFMGGIYVPGLLKDAAGEGKAHHEKNKEKDVETLALLTNDSAVPCMFYQGRPVIEPSEDGESSATSADNDSGSPVGFSSTLSMESFKPLAFASQNPANLGYPMSAHAAHALLASSSFGAVTHSDVILCLAISPTRSLVATGNSAGSVFIWQMYKDPHSTANNTNSTPSDGIAGFGGGLGLKCVYCASVHCSAVIALTFSCDSSLLLSCGADGSVFILAVDRPAHIEYEFETSRHSVRARKYQHSNTTVVVVPNSVPHGHHGHVTNVDPNRLWIQEKKDEEMTAMRSHYADTVSELTESAAALAQRLKILLDRNQTRSDLERMQRGEFAVDLQLRDSIISDNTQTVARIRDNYRLRDYWNELQAARVRMQCYDNMQVSGRSILPFNTDNTGDVRYVSAFSIPRTSEEEQSMVRKVRRLRAIEMRSMRAQAQSGYGAVNRLPTEGKVRSCWAPNVQGQSSHLNWLWGDGAAWPTAEVSTNIINKEMEARAAENAGKDKDNKEKDKDGKDKTKDVAAAQGASGANGGPGVTVAGENSIRVGEDDDDRSMNSQDTVADVDETDLFNLLYSPQCIRTDAQKRMHIVLVKEVVRQIKARFNEHFDRVVADKEAVMAAVDARNQRIAAILEELKQTEDVFRPVQGDVEKAGSAVTVSDAEIESRPFETEAMRAIR